MATTYYNDLQKLYVAYFNRPADTGGLTYWEGVLEANGGDLSTVSASFSTSAEYTAIYGNKSNEEIVDAIYQNLFGRPAEATGKAYWVEQLNLKGFTIDEAVKIIGDAAQGSDATAYGNKVKAATAFTAALDTATEIAGYAGADALALAKAFLAGITTDASYAAAVAPTALNETIAGVVHAGTPFALTTALASLDAANDALTAFLVTADGDDDATTSATELQITGAVSTADGVVGGLAGYTVNQSTGVKAAILADTQLDNTLELAAAEKDYAAAVAAADKVAGLSAAIAAVTATGDAKDATKDALDDAVVVTAAAKVAYEGYNGGTAITIGDDGAVAGLIEVKANGDLGLVAGVTEAKNKGVTALLNSIVARESAELADNGAAVALADAELTVEVADLDADGTAALLLVGQGITLTADLAADVKPTAAQIIDERSALQANVDAAADGSQEQTDAQAALDTFNGLVTDFLGANDSPLSSAVTTEAGNVEVIQTKIDDLAEAVADLTEAQGLATELAGLKEAITFAQDSFTLHDYKLPVLLGASATATSGSDIYLADDVATSRIVNFGAAGDDVLYVGSGFTLNTTGDLTKGSNSALEVFFVKSGASTNVIVETSAFGSNSAAHEYLTITLTGVAPEQLKFENGIITHV